MMKSIRGLPIILSLMMYLRGLISSNLSLVSANPTTPHPRGDKLDATHFKKEDLSKMLHYSGLEDPPPNSAKDVPKYIEYSYDALESLDHDIWQMNVNELHNKSSDQTIWGIKVHNVVFVHGIKIQFRIQDEVFKVNRTHIQLVFNRNIFGQSGPNLRHISLCAVNLYRSCHTEHNRSPDQFEINNEQFYVYNVTRLFENWIATVQDELRPVVLMINIPRIHSGADGMFTRADNDGLLLVIFSNLPHDLLQNYKIEQEQNQSPISNHRNHRRLRRSVADPDSADDYTDSRSITSLANIQEPNYCSLITWYIDFKVIGWDSFILWPKGFDGNLCIGSCTIPMIGSHVDISNHAFIKNLYQMEILYAHRSHLSTHIPKVNCMPFRLLPISIMFKSGSDTFINRNLFDMRAAQCSCL